MSMWLIMRNPVVSRNNAASIGDLPPFCRHSSFSRHPFTPTANSVTRGQSNNPGANIRVRPSLSRTNSLPIRTTQLWVQLELHAPAPYSNTVAVSQRFGVTLKNAQSLLRHCCDSVTRPRHCFFFLETPAHDHHQGNSSATARDKPGTAPVLPCYPLSCSVAPPLPPCVACEPGREGGGEGSEEGIRSRMRMAAASLVRVT